MSLEQEIYLDIFSADIEEAAKLVDLHVVDFVRLLALRFLYGVIRRSPVDTGRFRGSWRIGVGSPSDDVAPEGYEATGSVGALDAGSDAEGSLRGIKGDDVVFITNSLPYAVPLEEGWSKQAPHGMVKITVAELEAEIRAMR